MKNFMKKIIIGTMCCTVTAFAAPSIWNGTADESWYWNNQDSRTYTITKAEQLAGLAKLVNRSVFDFTGRTLVLDADIFLNDTTGAGSGTWGDVTHRNWTPIGTNNTPFRGTFDGSAGTENHRIYGLYVNTTSDYVGLFGKTDSAKIVNLDILVGKINSRDDVGMLIGNAKKTEISNVHVKAEVKGSDRVGGLVGSSSVSHIIVTNSSFEGYVTGANYIGGLVGWNSKIVNSHSLGSVTGEGNFVGGLCGYGSNITDSYFKGDVAGGDYVGGLCGSGSITDSYFKGDVAGGDYVGGLCGSGSITDSYFNGDVVGENYVGGLIGSGRVFASHSLGSVLGVNYVGGLAGEAPLGVENVYKNSYFEGKVVASGNYVGGLVGLGVSSYSRETVIENSYAIADVEGFNYVGGIIGCDSMVEEKSESSKVSFVNSYSRGNVRGNSYIGGIVGRYVSNKANQWSFECDVISSHHSGSVSGDSDYVGGLIGFNRTCLGYVDSSFHDGGSVSGTNYIGGLIGYEDSLRVLKNSYSEGNVVGLGDYVGGVCGSVLGDSINYTYHTSGTVNGDEYVGGLIGCGEFWSVNHSYHTDGNVDGTSYIGGLIGLMGGTPYNYGKKKGILKNSYSVGDVHVMGPYAGGVIGYLKYGDVDSSYHIGNVNNEDAYTGGLVGYCYYYSQKNSDVVLTIRNSYAYGDYIKGANAVGGVVGSLSSCCNVETSYYGGDSVVGAMSVGGLVGSVSYMNSAVSNSYSTADVFGEYSVGGLVGSSQGSVKKSYALGDVRGSKNVGGLVGYYNGSESSASISESWAKGNVYGDTAVGGLVGNLDNASIENSYANGNVLGTSRVGGLVGYVRTSGSYCRIKYFGRNYVSGTVDFGDEEGTSFGCLIGYVYGDCDWDLDMSYYDKDKCILGVYGEFEGSGRLSGGGVESQAKTTTEMQIQSTFIQWDFTDIWAISDNSYPYHQNFSNFLPNADVVTDSLSGFMYDGLPKMPKVNSVVLFGNELIEGVDYTVEYKNNLNAGLGRIKICGVNVYSGCKTIKFEIAAIPVEITIDPVVNVVYTGKEQTPKVNVYNGESLMGDESYIVEYKNNVNVGVASVIVTLNGNYSGTASTTFTIERATPVISRNPIASDVLIGETLESSDLSDGYSDVEGAFVWKAPEVKPALENEGYAVEFIPTDVDNYNSVEIIIPIKVWDVAYVAVHLGNMTLDSAVVIKGNAYTLPTVSDSVGYDFVGFYSGISKVGDSGDEIVVKENTIVDAVYKVKTFVVKFVNGDTELQSEKLAYGTLPKYKGDNPAKKASVQWTYSFKEWVPEISFVTESATYAAVFDSVVNRYVVSFMNGNTELLHSEVAYGTVPVAPMVTLPENTAQYTYSFAGWDKDVVAVTESTTYTAIIDSVVNRYEVSFKNYDGILIKDSTYEYGSTVAKPTDPIRAATAKFAYTFRGWTPIIASVMADAVYTAVFDSVVRSYAITFVSGSDTLQFSSEKYGVMPSYTGEIPIKKATARYEYTFKGWSPLITSVSGDATYKAVFDSTVKKYAVTFMNGDKKLQTSSVTYGLIPKYSGVTPTKASTKNYSYEFTGWSPKIEKVVGEATYQAVFDSTKLAGIMDNQFANLEISVSVISRNIQISAAPVGSAYAIFDMQGKVLKNGRVESANFNIAVSQAGIYMIRIGSHTQRISVK